MAAHPSDGVILLLAMRTLFLLLMLQTGGQCNSLWFGHLGHLVHRISSLRLHLSEAPWLHSYSQDNTGLVFPLFIPLSSNLHIPHFYFFAQLISPYKTPHSLNLNIIPKTQYTFAPRSFPYFREDAVAPCGISVSCAKVHPHPCNIVISSFSAGWQC